MRKLIVGAQVSLDGVMQALGGPTEDPTGDFEFGGWIWPFADAESGEELTTLFAQDFDLLLGRKTYEIFAAYWPFYEGSEHGGIAERLNAARKYCVSKSGEVDTSWKGTSLVRSIDEVARLREQDGPPLLTQGSTELIHALMAHDLVDTLSLLTAPVILGRGKKLFADGSAPHTWKLAHSRVSSGGVVITRYERGGAVESGAHEEKEPSALELARRARVAREG